MDVQTAPATHSHLRCRVIDPSCSLVVAYRELADAAKRAHRAMHYYPKEIPAADAELAQALRRLDDSVGAGV